MTAESRGKAAESKIAVDDISSAGPESDEVAVLAEELRQTQDRYIRAQAELENYRKRVQREREEEYRYREIPLLGDLLPVLDNISRALAAAEKHPDAAALKEGFKMLAHQLNDVLQKHACVKIAAQGEPFDPNVHQAILHQPSADQPENTVLLEAQAGYKVHDRVLRPAHVIVAKKPDDSR